MNDLTNITPGHGLTMTSLEIAAYTGKRHDHIMRDIKKMLAELEEPAPKFGGSYIGADNTSRPLFNLPKRETIILVSGYSVQMRAAIIDRWAELESAIALASSGRGTVTELDAEVRKVMGGIFKAIVHSELTNIIPALVRSELASQSLSFRRGRTAGQIWRDAGFPRIKVTSWFSNRLCAMGCQIDGGGKGELGLYTAKLFDPDKAENWLKNGGRALVERYIAERQGQGILRLVPKGGA